MSKHGYGYAWFSSGSPLDTLTTASTNGTWTFLGQPMSLLTMQAVFTAASCSSGTCILQGSLTSAPSTAMGSGILPILTADNTTMLAFNSSGQGIPVTWVRANVTALSTGTCTVHLAGIPA